MTLPTRNFDQIVADQTAALQVAQPLFSMSPGSVLQALAEANAGIALFLQYLTFKTIEATRLATCEAADCDSFGADFLFARYPAVPSTGQVQFVRFTAPNQLNIPLNTIVKTSNKSVTILVIADPSNAAYNDVLQAFVMNPGVFNVSVLVQAVVPGSIGNVSAGSITKIASSLAIGSISNPAPFVNGVDAETDAAYKSRFQYYINTRSAATQLAIENAIINTQTGLSYTISENINADGTPLPGNVLIYVDDGTGFPPPLLITTLQSNVNQIRPAAVSFSLEPANAITVSIEMSTTFAPGYNRNNYVGTIALAVENYINSLGVGQTLYQTRLYGIVYDSIPGVLLDVYDLLINGVAGDLVIAQNQVARFIAQIPAGSSQPVSEMTIN